MPGGWRPAWGLCLAGAGAQAPNRAVTASERVRGIPVRMRERRMGERGSCSALWVIFTILRPCSHYYQGKSGISLSPPDLRLKARTDMPSLDFTADVQPEGFRRGEKAEPAR